MPIHTVALPIPDGVEWSVVPPPQGKPAPAKPSR
jgi:hypothetical protein